MKQLLQVLFIIPTLSLLLAITHDIEIGGFSFTPSEIEIAVGDNVKWTNNHSFNHTATSTDFPQAWDDATISPNGGTFEVIFDAIGTFPYDCDFHASMTGTITVTALELDNSTTLIETFQLHYNYPHPFNPTTSIEYILPENTAIELIIYNIQGRKLQTLIKGFKFAGHHSINWNASNYSSGVYLVKMIAGDYINTQKLILVK